MEKEPESNSVWESLKLLFHSISNGNPVANLPQYNGSLFEFDETLDSLEIKTKYLVSAIKELTEIEGKGIDYQNFGVRQLGSIYESLLDYTVKQAENDLVVIKDEFLDFTFASNLNTKPSRVIEKGDLYLSAGGLARKGTGTYYTPEKIVKFLVQKGLQPIFVDRETKFIQAIEKWRRTKTEMDATSSTNCLLDIQAVDPAMGSGHFLVIIVDEITKLIMSILQRYPDAPLADEIGKDRSKILSEQNKCGITLDADLLAFNVVLKRKVMKRCIFGVDVNPLAVELAKLSMWLDSFTIGTPLTFLDHHIRCGDSLIGLWIDSLKATSTKSTTLDFWTDNMESMGNTLHQISLPADLSLADFRRNMESYSEFRKKSKPLRVLLDMITASKMDTKLQQEFPKNFALVERAIKNHEWEQAPWSKITHAAISYSEKYHFFHWELEFPDAYTDERRGFDLVVMNPPWDAVKPEDDDFFSFYYPTFRKMKSKPEKNKVKSKLLQNETIQAAFIEYTNSILRRVAFYKSPGQYLKRGGGDTDMWKLFLERGLSILSENGTLSIVTPYGIITNEGAKELRISVLNKNLRYLYEFENLKGIFPDVHRSYKFVLLVVDNKKPLGDFPAAFYLHDIGALEERQVEKRKFVEISRDFIKLVSPFSLSIPEIRDSKELNILEKLCRNHRLLHYGLENSQSETWTIGFVTEMHRTGSSHLFRTDGKGWPLIEGKNFHQFIPSYERTDFTISPEEGLKWTSKIREFGNLNREFHDVVRLAFRDVASSTNVRAMISCIIPRHSFLPHTAPIIVPKLNGKLLLDEQYHRIIAYLAGIFNSTIFDFLIRRRITTHLSYFFLEQIPIPYKLNDTFVQEITEASGRLSSVDESFKDLAKAVGVEYGPMKMEERIELTANLDALVCCNYGLSRPEYEYILDTFDAFEQDEKLKNIGEQNEWNDAMIRKLNGEVKKRAIYYYDKITERVSTKR